VSAEAQQITASGFRVSVFHPDPKLRPPSTGESRARWLRWLRVSATFKIASTVTFVELRYNLGSCHHQRVTRVGGAPERFRSVFSALKGQRPSQ